MPLPCPLLLPSPGGSSFCCSRQGMVDTPAASPGAIRRARPRRWPQISWIYRAPHTAPPAAPLPPFGLCLHLLLPSSRLRQNTAARRGQRGHSLGRSRGGNCAQFSWSQGGFVPLFFITACGEISFIKIVRLGGATLLTRWKNRIFSFLAGVFVIALSPPSYSTPPRTSPSIYRLSLPLLPPWAELGDSSGKLPPLPDGLASRPLNVPWGG